MPSPTRNRIEAVAVCSTLPVYFIVWTAGISNGFRSQLVLLATLTAATYVGMHLFEFLVRGHCFLSADSSAAPITTLVFGALLVTFSRAGTVTSLDIVDSIGGFCLSFMVGHVAALLFSASVAAILKWLLRTRIDTELKREAGPRQSRGESSGSGLF